MHSEIIHPFRYDFQHVWIFGHFFPRFGRRCFRHTSLWTTNEHCQLNDKPRVNESLRLVSAARSPNHSAATARTSIRSMGRDEFRLFWNRKTPLWKKRFYRKIGCVKVEVLWYKVDLWTRMIIPLHLGLFLWQFAQMNLELLRTHWGGT